MNGSDEYFIKLLDQTVQWTVPVFQRDYLWQTAHCDRLLRDVLRISNSDERQEHFIGSIVAITGRDAIPGFFKWLLVDGQQRLTTLTLLAAALRDHIRWIRAHADSPSSSEELPEWLDCQLLDTQFLKNGGQRGAQKYKIVLRPRDTATLHAIVDGTLSSLPSPSSQLKENYEFYCEELKQHPPVDIYNGMARLRVISINLTQGKDDAQLVFESLNSTGIPLAQSDLVRNLFLMNLPLDEQHRLYNAYWKEIEDLYRDHAKDLQDFLKVYLAWRTNTKVKEDLIHEKFRAFLRDRLASVFSSSDIEAHLASLRRSARHYAEFALPNGRARSEFDRALARLRSLNVRSPLGVLLLRLFDLRERTPSLLSANAFGECLKSIETYLVRRAVCRLPSNSYSRAFAAVARAIRDDHPFDSFQVALVTRKYHGCEFPSDDAFRDNLLSSEIYEREWLCRHLLEGIENEGSKERLRTGNLTIEHIMPQRLTPAWEEMLGDDAHEIHQVWLHRLGNLTLTAYNTEYGNEPFEQKRDMVGGYRDSPLRLNRQLGQRVHWGSEEIQERNSTLANRALTVWPRPVIKDAVIQDIKMLELRDRAKNRDWTNTEMGAGARRLVDLVRPLIIRDGVIEIAYTKSIAYYCPEWVLEVVPKMRVVHLVFGAGIEEVKDLPYDAVRVRPGERKKITNAKHWNQARAWMKVESVEDVEKSRRVIEVFLGRGGGRRVDV